MKMNFQMEIDELEKKIEGVDQVMTHNQVASIQCTDGK